MAKPIPTPSYEALLAVVAQFPSGASLEQIEASLTQAPTRRTLQRWVNELLAQGRLRKEGQSRVTRYLPGGAVAISTPAVRQTDAAAQQAQTLIPLSDAAQAIEAHVRQPIPLRTPVGYRREFLDGYRPIVSFYLPAALRAELLAHGQAVTTHEPAGTYARQIAHRLLIDLSWNSSRLE
ncbi:MAG: Fic family protein, partial [Polaromonas sp.]|nr:Fic family protein [Polaromonas sp.]